MTPCLSNARQATRGGTNMPCPQTARDESVSQRPRVPAPSGAGNSGTTAAAVQTGVAAAPPRNAQTDGPVAPRGSGAGHEPSPGADSGFPGRPFRQKLVLYHPNSAGTGAALQLEPRLNRSGTDRYNCFFVDMAAQRAVASTAGGKQTPAAFDWDGKLTAKLDFADICEILAVLEGRAEKLGGQRNGLFHRSGDTTTVITLQKSDRGGYFFGLSRKSAGDDSASRVSISLSEAEAIGLRAVFQAGLFFITFHSHLFHHPAWDSLS